MYAVHQGVLFNLHSLISIDIVLWVLAQIVNRK